MALPPPDEAPATRWAAEDYPDYAADVNSSIDFSGLPQSFFTRGKAEKIIEKVRALQGASPARLLDIGCGPGLIHAFLPAAEIQLTGVDVNAGAIAAAQAQHQANAYLTYDGRALPFEDASFDIAVAICVIHHVPPAEWGGFVREVRRVLRPGGVMVVCEHNPLNPLTRLAVHRCKFDHDAVLLRAGSMAKLMRDADFEPAQIEYIFFTPFDVAIVKRLERAIRWLPLGAQYVATARKPA
ncbi:class I SAM-dependent methyltransferase [Rhodopseudomonas palustris]|uniref:Methyltransferase type 11 n=1 Tax=Rhodopseudomonas palustris (strain BisB18) TaxID=316056 RepID=Q20YT0_RHOPB